ncbi:MAG: Hsp20/alpha crystallin family protein [Myxococcota bacterium]|nr:Hsp20/alpha crystallin family protein [Myxococcota bacterium]
MLNDSFFSWDPFRELSRLQTDLNRAFATANGPAFNVWTGQDGAVVTAELPGFSAESFDVSVFGKTITVRGERKPVELEGATTHRRERQTGSFVRAIELPFRIEADKVDAKFERGVLQITLPRAEADKRRSISINAN